MNKNTLMMNVVFLFKFDSIVIIVQTFYGTLTSRDPLKVGSEPTSLRNADLYDIILGVKTILYLCIPRFIFRLY